MWFTSGARRTETAQNHICRPRDVSQSWSTRAPRSLLDGFAEHSAMGVDTSAFFMDTVCEASG
jgi:hypothetical protein